MWKLGLRPRKFIFWEYINGIFVAVHIAYSFTGMLSACANPILYGLLNENFKSEFKLIFKTFFHK
jgi:hypothetical protein